jgi:hypothetical protein
MPTISVSQSLTELDTDPIGLLQRFEQCARRAHNWKIAKATTAVGILASGISFPLLIIPLVPVFWLTEEKHDRACEAAHEARSKLAQAIVRGTTANDSRLR